MRIKRFFKKIAKILAYLPILWEDEDWDYEYMIQLLRYKLIRIKNCIIENDIIIEGEQREIARTIDKTVAHIDNYKNADEVYESLHKLPFEVGHCGLELDNGNSRFFAYNRTEGRELTKAEDEQYSQYIKNKVAFEQKEWEAIWDTIKEHGQKWWD